MPEITIEKPLNNATFSRYAVTGWGYVEPPLGGGTTNSYRVRCELSQGGIPKAWAENCVRTLDGDRVIWQVNFGSMPAGDYKMKASRMFGNDEAGSISIDIHLTNSTNPTYHTPPLRPLDPTYQNDTPMPFTAIIKNDDAEYYLLKTSPPDTGAKK